VALRTWTRTRLGGRPARWMAALNARHPWSHNDHFHPWVIASLPDRRRRAVEVGCGHGELAATLAAYVDEVVALDRDATMREVAAARCAGLPQVTVTDSSLADLEGPVDVVTMVAVLHHLDVGATLREVRRLLAPGGRLLVVGLAPPASLADHVWDVACIVSNPVIGWVKHPWPARGTSPLPPVPIAEPRQTVADLRTVLDRELPGAVLRRREGFRITIEWTQPEPGGPDAALPSLRVGRPVTSQDVADMLDEESHQNHQEIP